jgi:sugar/nucleoside kinase (ribokinase family)
MAESVLFAERFAAVNEKDLENLLARFPGRTIGVVGDFCVDAYWELRPELGERSIETGIVTTPVGAARYSPGGAGNLAANLRGLGAGRIFCFGAAGRDPFGDWLCRALFPGDCLLRIEREEYQTPVYCKPLLSGREQSRFDLGGVEVADGEAEEVLRRLEKRLPELDALVINQQLRRGLHSEFFRRGLAALLKRAPGRLRVVFDGRDHLDAYPGAISKIDAAAASRLAFGRPGAPPEESAAAVARRNGAEAVVTDGENGCFVCEAGGVKHVPAIALPGPVDTVGAGDSFGAGFALALAAGATLETAAELGSLCAAVTVHKIAQTGVPSPEELSEVFSRRHEIGGGMRG